MAGSLELGAWSTGHGACKEQSDTVPQAGGQGAWGMVHGAWGIEHGAWGMGHGACGMEHAAWSTGQGAGGIAHRTVD